MGVSKVAFEVEQTYGRVLLWYTVTIFPKGTRLSISQEVCARGEMAAAIITRDGHVTLLREM